MIRTEDILDLLDQGIDTVPDMACHILGIERVAPSKMDEMTRREYHRVHQQLCVRLVRMRKWREVEVVHDPLRVGKERIWRAVA